MEENRESTRYWCHQCESPVIPILGIETVKCSFCNGEFVEEMDSVSNDQHQQHHGQESGGSDLGLDPDRAVSLWAPILFGMMNNPRRRRRFARIEFEEDEEEDDRHDSYERYRRYQFRNPRAEGESDLDRELQAVMRQRRRQRSDTILQLLDSAQAGTGSESGNNASWENGNNGSRERVILINPFNQTIIVQGGGGNGSQTHPIGSLGDYFSGPRLELFLQHLAENDPNRYGTPPAQKEAIDAMPTVIVDEPSVQCSVCLDDFEVGIEAKEMPCKHKFHSKCILPWLELHSSCPVCRFRLPSDESKLNQERDGSSSDSENVGNTRRFSVSLPWPFSSLFPSTTGPETETGSSVTSTSGSGSYSLPRAREPHREEDNH